MTRYEQMFARLNARGEAAFVPFTVLGDPDPASSLEVMRAMVRGGADALELGLAFSDPIADGPTIQAADLRALAAGMRPSHAWGLIAALRQEYPQLPIGMLVYANLIEAAGREQFYRAAATAGVDSVLVADVPSLEAEPFVAIAKKHGVLPVLIATASAPDATLRRIAAQSAGYIYVVTRAGVTGADSHAQSDQRELLAKLTAFNAPPALLGFGIARPEHVRAALQMGAAGAISGSAVIDIMARQLGNIPAMLDQVTAFVRSMKAAAHG